MQTDIQALFQNPHFVHIHFLLERENVSSSAFERLFQDMLAPLLETHKLDSAVSKDEEYHYILPAIAVYRTLQHFLPNTALELFREMWIYGAELGAQHLREKAKNQEFLTSWIPNVTPKNCMNAGLIIWFVYLIAAKAER